MRVLFLRPKGSYVPQIEDAEVINIELFEPRCIKYEKPNYAEFDAVIFTSVNSIRCFEDHEEIRDKLIFTVGPSTAKYLSNYSNVKYPNKYTTMSLAELVLNSGVKSAVAFRSKRANQTMREILKKIKYIEIYNYDLILNYFELEKARNFLQNCKVDIVVLTSSEIAKAVKDFLRKGCYTIISIGPVTSRVLADLGISFEEAKTHDINGVLEIISKYKVR